MKVKKQKKGEKVIREEIACAVAHEEEFCNLYFSAVNRCPYLHSRKAFAKADSSVQGYIDASPLANITRPKIYF